MSKISAFLHPVETVTEREVIVSDRFRDEKGNPVPFKVRALTQEENDKITAKATRVTTDKNGQRTEYLDSVDYARRLIVAATVEPDFTSKELCDAYGVVSPFLVPGKMLLSGEYSRLMEAVMQQSRFRGDVEAEEVKN